MAIMDLNGDGKLDVALANWGLWHPGSGPQNVTVLLGNGDGTFGKPWNGPNVFAIAGLAAGDVDGDKIPDLVVTHNYSDGIGVMKGNGDGTFQAEKSITYATSVGDSLIQLVDLNGDGKLDILTSDWMVGTAVLLGNGDGTFQPSQSYATSGASGYATGDVNGDGIPDIAMSGGGGGVTVLLGNGDGSFSPRADLPLGISQADIMSATIADFNGDGKLDIAVAAGQNGSGLAVLLNKGDGSFAAPVFSPWRGVSNTLSAHGAGDFNNDGHVDLVVGGEYLLLGKGDGTFGAPIRFNMDVLSGPFVVGDFNNDGNPDVVVVGGYGETQPIELFLGNGDGTFQPERRFWNLKSIPGFYAVAADFNRDGDLDLAVTVNPSGVAVLLGDGKGNFANPVIYPTDDLPFGLALGDLNKDGIPDLIATTSQNLDVFMGKGDGTFKPYVEYTPAGFPFTVTTGDFDGDGKVDVALTSTSGLELFFGNGNGTFSARVGFMASGGPMFAADLNGDGIDDILIAGGNGSLFMSAPFASLSPSQLNFGKAGTGVQSPSLPVRISNVGLGPLHVNGATVGAPFSVSTSGCQFAIGKESSCSLEAAVQPSTAGTDYGQILIDSDARNGRLAVPVTVTAITKATPTIKWVTPAAITYGAALSATQLNASSQVAGTFTYSPALGKVLGAGTQTLSATFTPKDSANYNTVSASVTLVVNQAASKITWATPAAIKYGAALSATQLNASSGTAGKLVYSPPLGTVLAAGSQTLSVTLNPTDAADFAESTATVKLTVNQGTLTVTAANLSRAYGVANPAFTATMTGFANGETAGSAVTGLPAFTSKATSSSAVGSYPITVSAGSLAAANYTFKFVAGTLTITKATLTVTAINASVAYNQPIPKLGYTATGFVNGDTSSALKGAASETTTAKPGSAVGTYPITITQGTLAAGNYSFTFASGTLTVTSLGTAVAPVFNPPGGTYTSAQTAKISSSTPGAVIYYTTNGSQPTTSSTRYAAAGVKVSASETINAIAVAPGYAQSGVTPAAYVINPP